MKTLVFGLFMAFSFSANAYTGVDHSGGDPTPTSCLAARVQRGNSGSVAKAEIDLDFESRGTPNSKFSRHCLVADVIRTMADKRYFRLSSDTNVNAYGLGLDEARVIYRFVCTYPTSYEDFYVIEGQDGKLTARYSQFLVQCPMTLK